MFPQCICGKAHTCFDFNAFYPSTYWKGTFNINHKLLVLYLIYFSYLVLIITDFIDHELISNSVNAILITHMI